MDEKKILNNFTLVIANINGTGSMSANGIIFKSLLRMGIPASAKNLFPSNIQGLPTWYSIRASDEGYLARRESNEILVALNPETLEEDLSKPCPGGVFIFDSSAKDEKDFSRSDLTYYGIPLKKLQVKIENAKLRKVLSNLIYVGAVAELFGIDFKILQSIIEDNFKEKPKVIPANLDALMFGINYVRENLPKRDPFSFQKMETPKGKIICDGNTAAALGLAFGGCQFLSWYPITPSSTLPEAAIGFLEDYRKTPEGEKTFVVVQGEDELASVGMAVGAGWTGVRACTATSGPGISLMNEFIGLAYYAEIPVVISNIQRMGPSTGLPTRTSQGDLEACYYASHGDTRHILLFPSSLKECFEFMMECFDLAESFQCPVFFMSDLDLGMNIWMGDPFVYPENPLKRGKVLPLEKMEEFLAKGWGRYKDLDGDGVPWRTLPGINHPKGNITTRGTGHDEYGRYSENDQVYVQNLDRIALKYETAKKSVPAPEISGNPGSKIGLIAYGSSHFSVHESLHRLANEGLSLKYLRLRALPLTDQVEKFVGECDRVYVIEQNQTGQLFRVLKKETSPELAPRYRSVRYYAGLPITTDFVMSSIKKGEK